MTTVPFRSRPLTRRGARRLLGGAGLLTARCGAPERAAAPLQDEPRSPVAFPDGERLNRVAVRCEEPFKHPQEVR